jgi:hypothetical protein
MPTPEKAYFFHLLLNNQIKMQRNIYLQTNFEHQSA